MALRLCAISTVRHTSLSSAFRTRACFCVLDRRRRVRRHTSGSLELLQVLSVGTPPLLRLVGTMNMNGGVDAITQQQASNNPASSKQTKPNLQPVDSHSVSRRLQSELMALMTCGDPGISAFPDGDNIFTWIGTIKGSNGTVYEGLSYKLSLRFPTDYPFKPPTVKFETLCFHPNVDQHGNICLDILQDKWSSAYDVRTVLLSIQSLLGEPNNDSPLNSYAAALWNNQEEYKKVMHKQYRDACGGTVR